MISASNCFCCKCPQCCYSDDSTVLLAVTLPTTWYIANTSPCQTYSSNPVPSGEPTYPLTLTNSSYQAGITQWQWSNSHWIYFLTKQCPHKKSGPDYPHDNWQLSISASDTGPIQMININTFNAASNYPCATEDVASNCNGISGDVVYLTTVTSGFNQFNLYGLGQIAASVQNNTRCRGPGMNQCLDGEANDDGTCLESP